jgi:hypothetical protein
MPLTTPAAATAAAQARQASSKEESADVKASIAARFMFMGQNAAFASCTGASMSTAG